LGDVEEVEDVRDVRDVGCLAEPYGDCDILRFMMVHHSI